MPVNPTDPIAVINNEVITRQQLADECVARKGKEILDTMINRRIIDQALRATKQEVTAAEIDQEIDSVARRFGIGREAWLRTLTSVRLAVATRLGITDAESADELDQLDGSDPRSYMVSVYDWLGFAQETMVGAL